MNGLNHDSIRGKKKKNCVASLGNCVQIAVKSVEPPLLVWGWSRPNGVVSPPLNGRLGSSRTTSMAGQTSLTTPNLLSVLLQ